MLVVPTGRVVVKLPYDRHGVIVANVLPELARDKAIYAGNDRLADRRPTTYEILVRNYQDTPVSKIANEPIVPARATSKVAAIQIHIAENLLSDDLFSLVDHPANLRANALAFPNYALILPRP